MVSVKLPSMDNTPGISLYGSHSFLLFPFPRFLPFLHFSHHCFGRAPTTKLFHLPADSTNSFYSIPEQESCLLLTSVYTLHLYPLSKPSTKTSQQHPRPRVASFLFCIRPQLHKIAALPPALVIFLYLFCVNTYECAHGQLRSVFIRAGDGGMPAV